MTEEVLPQNPQSIGKSALNVNAQDTISDLSEANDDPMSSNRTEKVAVETVDKSVGTPTEWGQPPPQKHQQLAVI